MSASLADTWKATTTSIFINDHLADINSWLWFVLSDIARMTLLTKELCRPKKLTLNYRSVYILNHRNHLFTKLTKALIRNRPQSIHLIHSSGFGIAKNEG